LLEHPLHVGIILKIKTKKQKLSSGR